MIFNDLRAFIQHLESIGELKRITYPVSSDQEISEIADRVLRNGGPALLFENVVGYDMPVLANLFGTIKRVAIGMGQQDVQALRAVGHLLSYLKEPEPPKGFKDVFGKLSIFKKVLHMPVKRRRNALCQQIIWQGDEVDLDKIPVMHCWAEDVAPLLTWGLTITQGPHKKRQNLGIYRQQKIAKNKIIMRWLAHRGGALDFRDWTKTHPNKPFPVSIAFGADPGTILGAVTPVPDTLSEYAFAGLLRGSRTQVTKSISNDLDVPANAEIIMEGYIDPDEYADEGPYGDHTGYYNEIERHHVVTITHITMRQNPIYHSTYTGRPPDEPAVLGVALNDVFVPILQKQFPEIIDFYLPSEGCSYRLAVVTIKKQYLGHAKRVMMGVWSFLRQFMYTKFIIVCDADVDVRNWESVFNAILNNTDVNKDILLIDNTPIDSLDFASPIAGLGSKMGLDATLKWSAEKQPNNILNELMPVSCTENRWTEKNIKEQFPTIIDSYLFSSQNLSKMLIVSLDKKNIGQGFDIIDKIWSLFDVKLIIVCDVDINIRHWDDIIWAITTRMDPKRDIKFYTSNQTKLTDNSPSRIGFDATNKLAGESSREWGRPIIKNEKIVAKIDLIWNKLGISMPKTVEDD